MSNYMKTFVDYYKTLMWPLSRSTISVWVMLEAGKGGGGGPSVGYLYLERKSLVLHYKDLYF